MASATAPVAPPPAEPHPAGGSYRFINSTAITIPTLGNGSVYPSNITVLGLEGNIGALKVTLNNLSHTYPDDLDVLLVAPNGTSFIVMSDAGASFDLTNATVTLDDAAASVLPDTSTIVPGSYRPSNHGTVQDPFAAPAPAGPYNTPASGGSATFASVFTGMSPANANGTWSLYVVDDVDADSGVMAGGWTLSITEATTAGQLIISEFRLRGPNGANDEFIELYNAGNSLISAQSADGSSGLGVAASDGVTRCVVPNGTFISPYGHFLCVNSVGYSLASYPAGNGTTATGDATYTTDIPDNAGMAIFNNSTGGASYSIANRLDAFGSTAEANATYKEGTGYPALVPFSTDYSFYRTPSPTTGAPADTGNNAADYTFVDSNGTSAGAGQRLGVPGPAPRTTRLSGRSICAGRSPTPAVET